MKNELMIFEGNNVEILELNGQVLFNPKDVAKILDIKNVNDNLRKMSSSQVVKVKNSEIGLTDFRKLNNAGENFLTESGVYKLAFKSRKPEAERFSDWVTDVVLPTIRKTGGYVNSTELMVNTYFPNLQEEQKIIVGSLLQNIEEQQKIIVGLKGEKDELQQFYDSLLSTEGLLPMNAVAKELNIGLIKLYSFLRDAGVIFYKGNINLPYQRYMEQELFKVKETPCRDGEYRPATYATRKGLEYIRKLLVKNSMIANA